MTLVPFEATGTRGDLLSEPGNKFQGSPGGTAGSESPWERDVGATRLQMQNVLAFAVEAKNTRLQIIEHCTRVATLSGLLADALALDEEEKAVVCSAAQLHELGMIAVPTELFQRPAPLTPQELNRVHAQAWISAEIVRSTYNPRTARLIEYQYTDHADICHELGLRGKDILLAGILRVADVFDVMGQPRPYQHAFPVSERIEVLRHGAGTRFHPEAVEAMYEVRERLG